MKWISATLVVAALSVPALCDSITLGRLTYKQVTVVAIDKNEIIFQINERVIRKKLPNVTRIYLTDDEDFTEAEKHRESAEENKSKAEYEKAKTLYLKAQKKATLKWHQDLISYRLTEVRDKINPPRLHVQETDNKNTGWEKDPLKLLKDIPDAPKDPRENKQAWELYSEWQKRLNLSKYKRAMTSWQLSLNKYRFKDVAWTVQVKEIAKEENGTGYILKAEPIETIEITARFPFSTQKMLLNVKPEDWVIIQGTIRETQLGEEKKSSAQKRPQQPRGRTGQPGMPDMPGMPGIPGGAAMPPRAKTANDAKLDAPKIGKDYPIYITLSGKGLTKTKAPKQAEPVETKVKTPVTPEIPGMTFPIPAHVTKPKPVPTQPVAQPKQPAPVQKAPQLTKVTLKADQVIFVLDNSAQAKDEWKQIRNITVNSVNQLSAKQSFKVLCSVSTTRNGNLMPASAANKAAAGKQVNAIRPGGATTNTAHLILQALNMLSGPQDQGRSKAICILTAGEFDINESVLSYIRKRNSNKQIAIASIVVGQGKANTVKALEELAKASSGKSQQIGTDGRPLKSAESPAVANIAPGMGVTLMGKTLEAQHVVFVIDRGESTKGSLDAMKAHLKAAINALGPKQTFSISYRFVFDPNMAPGAGPAGQIPGGPPAGMPTGMAPPGMPGMPGMMGPRTLLPANNKSKASALAELDSLTAAGKESPAYSLMEALSAFQNVRGQTGSKAVILITTQGFKPATRMNAMLKRANRSKIPIHTFLYGPTNDNAAKLLQQIAKDHNGTYNHVAQ